MGTILRLGTRASPLALAQARMAAAALCAAHSWPAEAIELVPFTTTGDRVLDRPLAEVGGKGLFTKELDAALLDGRIDLAVHSVKDVETWLPEGMRLAAMLPRADTRDRLIAKGCDDFLCLAHGARLGTSSLRRAAQALALRPDLKIVPFRGNVGTRLAKLAAGEADATLLAAAGLDRLGRAEVGAPVPIELFLPAPAQGAIGITVRMDDGRTGDLVAMIDDEVTSTAVFAERAFLAALDGTCRTPIAALATVTGDCVILRGEILSPDGSERQAGETQAGRSAATEVAAALGRELKRRASPALRALFGG